MRRGSGFRKSMPKAAGTGSATRNARKPPMTTNASNESRRRFIKITAAGLAAVPFASALLSGPAEAVDAVSESDPMATALGYKTDATKAGNRKENTVGTRLHSSRIRGSWVWLMDRAACSAASGTRRQGVV